MPVDGGEKGGGGEGDDLESATGTRILCHPAGVPVFMYIKWKLLINFGYTVVIHLPLFKICSKRQIP